MSSYGGFYDYSDARLKTFLKKIPIDFEKLYGLKKNYFV
jgi:hypothetical protein